jgi:heme exporter protein CcmD
MGGYAFYVWGAYALALIALGGEVWLLVRRERRWHSGLPANERASAKEVSP